MPISEELAVLIRRAERAMADARRLLAENERWRRYAERQLDAMFELSAEFRRAAVRAPPPHYPAATSCRRYSTRCSIRTRWRSHSTRVCLSRLTSRSA
ncbi:hypothetical protein ABH999_006791 [Bradyrhizobium yuanmingense]